MNRTHSSSFIIVLFACLLLAPPASATEEYADNTGQLCATCHIDVAGGGTLTPEGQSYATGGYTWPPPSSAQYTPRSTAVKVLRMLLGMAHLIAAFAWIGTILYVHLVLKPKYAKGGLPKTEMQIALFSIIVLGITGVALTKMRYHHPAALLESRSGILLLIKIGLFLFLVASALFVSQVLSPKLKKLRAGWQMNDGLNGHPAWVQVGETLYDVTQSSRWKDGTHFGRHQAGEDMSAALEDAPHGLEKLEGFPAFSLVHGELHKQTNEIRILYVLAYVNLFVAFGVLLIIGAWRFW